MKQVFHYEYRWGDLHVLIGSYKVLQETATHVQVRRWWGKVWYPKNNYWQVEDVTKGGLENLFTGEDK